MNINGIFAMGVVIASKLYDSSPPLLVVSADDYACLANEQQVTINADGCIELQA